MTKLIHWNSSLPDIFDDVYKIFENKKLYFSPAIDVYQTDSKVILEASLPGIDKKDISISVEGNVLIIEGKTERKTEVDEDNYYRKEVRSGSFYRSVQLPAYAITKDAEAFYDNGILRLEFSKIKDVKPERTKIDIK